MKIEKRLTTTITAFVLLAVLLIAAGGVPAVLSIRKIGEQMAEENRQIERAYALRRLTSNTETLVNNAHQRIAALGSMYIVEGDELAFISELENAAAASKITQTLQLETVNQKDLNPWEKEIPLKLSAEGDYRDIIVFLHQIEALPFYVTLRGLRIAVPSRQREFGAAGRVELYLEAAVRWRTKDHPAFRITDGSAAE